MPTTISTSPATQIASALADNAEAVCRRYLSKGRKEGGYWLVGDVHNTPGRSLYIRLSASPDGRGAAGKWTDAQNGDHGDLLDIIAAARNCRTMRETLVEARRFLSLPMPPPSETGLSAAAKRRPERRKLLGSYMARRSRSRAAWCAPISPPGTSATSPVAKRFASIPIAGIERRTRMTPMSAPHGRR